MRWKFVFNSDLKETMWGRIDKASKAAKDCGYEFFSWNGWVYHVDKGITRIKTEECI